MIDVNIGITEKDIKKMGLMEEFSSCDENEKEDFVIQAMLAAITVYGQAKRAGLLTDDLYQLDESKLGGKNESN